MNTLMNKRIWQTNYRTYKKHDSSPDTKILHDEEVERAHTILQKLNPKAGKDLTLIHTKPEVTLLAYRSQKVLKLGTKATKLIHRILYFYIFLPESMA